MAGRFGVPEHRDRLFPRGRVIPVAAPPRAGDGPAIARGRQGQGGLVIGVLAAVLCLGLTSLYLPGMPASLDAAPWILFGLWWVFGAAFFFRIPRGVKPGAHAEGELTRRLAERSAERRKN